MGFLDSLSKTLSSGVDRAKFEADKFQRTSRVSGEINNIKSQIDTNIRQLGERALELYQQGSITAPEIASLAQIIAQLRDQQTQKEAELNAANAETFESWQAMQPQASQGTTSQGIPISSEPSTGYTPTTSSSEPSTGYTPTTSSSSSADRSTTPSSAVPSGATHDQSATSAAPSFTGRAYDVSESTDVSGSGLPNNSSVGGQSSAAVKTCPNCSYDVPTSAAFCPNCGNRMV